MEQPENSGNREIAAGSICELSFPATLGWKQQPLLLVELRLLLWGVSAAASSQQAGDALLVAHLSLQDLLLLVGCA